MSNALQRSICVDARREPRYNVHWRARLQLLDGRRIDCRVKDISANGMGLQAAEPVPSGATLAVCVRVPDPGNSAQLSDLSGTVRVAYVAMRGYEFGIGVTWADRDAVGTELLSRWIGKLRLGPALSLF